jgi:hypothetical protein
MTTTTLTKTARTLIAAGTSNSAAGTTHGTPLDLRTKQGGMLTLKLTNGGTGPTVQATASVLIAHNDGSTPSADVAGATWKTLTTIGGGTTASAVTEAAIPIDPGVMHLHVAVSGNTGQAVTCEALFSEITSAVSA